MPPPDSSRRAARPRLRASQVTAQSRHRAAQRGGAPPAGVWGTGDIRQEAVAHAMSTPTTNKNPPEQERAAQECESHHRDDDYSVHIWSSP